MNTIVLGNIIALWAASLAIIVGIIKNKNKILHIQNIQYVAFVISNIILGGFSGVITNLISILRNILCYKEKLTKTISTLIILISIILTFKFNNLGFIGLLPLIANTIYTVFFNTKDKFKFKLLVIVTMLLWIIYDLTIKSYWSAIIEIISTFLCAITAFEIYTNRKKRRSNKINFVASSFISLNLVFLLLFLTFVYNFLISLFLHLF